MTHVQAGADEDTGDVTQARSKGSTGAQGRGMYPAAALMEIVEAHQVRIEAVMDAIDMKTFGLMAVIGKIELDNFRERAAMGRRGAAKQGRIPSGGLPYGYRTGEGRKPEVVEAEADVVRRIFHEYVHEGLGIPAIAWQLTDEGVPTPKPGTRWHQSQVHRIIGNAAYKGTWSYGRRRVGTTEEGTRVYAQPEETWIGVTVPALVDEETWKRAQQLKKQRLAVSKRNTKVSYLLQHLLRCTECGLRFRAKAAWDSRNRRNGKVYRYEASMPRRYYHCHGVSRRLRCRERPYIRAERLEELVWGEVKRVLQNPALIVADIDALGDRESSFADEIAKTERQLGNVQMEEDRAIRLYVSGKITEAQLDLQRKFITERLESLRAKVDDYRAREASGAEKRELTEAVLAWASNVGEGLDDLSPEQRKEVLRMVVEEVTVDRENNLDITLAVPIEEEGESVAIASQPSPMVARQSQRKTAVLVGRRLRAGLKTTTSDETPQAFECRQAPTYAPLASMLWMVASGSCETGTSRCLHVAYRGPTIAPLPARSPDA